MTVIQGNGNPFAGTYGDQCTYWAQQRYHDLTGLWTPCTGNGADWASQARGAGWQVTASPPKVPSIICLQPGVQLADPNYGHVGVVERVNNDGSVYTSNYNAYPHLGDKVVVYLTFQQGNGVSFIYADASATISPTAPTQQPTTNLSATANLATPTTSNVKLPSIKLGPHSGITDVLIGIDDHLTIVNPFDVQASMDTITLPFSGSNVASFTSPISYIEGFGSNLVTDFSVVILRLILLGVGFFIIYSVLNEVIDLDGAVANPRGAGGDLLKKAALLAL